jgi:hypothetical protein
MLNKLGRAAVILAVASSLGAVTEASSQASTMDNPYFPKWKVTHVGKAYTTYGKWKTCVTFSKDSTPHSVTCSLAKTTSTTVSGTLTVSVKAVSAAVGYQAQRSYTVTGGETYTPKKNKSGRVQWRETYHTNKVTEKEYMCPLHGTCSYSNPIKTSYAYAHKYVAPNFGIAYN